MANRSGIVSPFVAVFGIAGLALYAWGAYASARVARPPARAAAPDANASFAIVGARVFDGTRVLTDATVVVRGEKIVNVGAGIEPPPGAAIVEGRGRTLLPGLIDAHTHAFGDALERALTFGVTTELDMFTAAEFAEAMRKEQRAGRVVSRADLFSAGTLVTAPKGHGTEYGMKIPTIAGPSEADAFVAARIAEGSDYIKIVYDGGATYGLKIATIDRETLRAVIEAAHRRGRKAVVHVGAYASAVDAIEAGADGLVHVFSDRPSDAAFVERVVASKAFVIPTLTVIESTTGVPSGAGLAKGSPLSPYLTSQEVSGLTSAFPTRASSKSSLDAARTSVRMLHEAGVPVLAGSDAPNPGTTHGASIHRELQLLVSAGLTPAQALAAATSVPAERFGIGDRGRIAAGMRADLLLVSGDPLSDISATQNIAGIWKAGAEVARTRADAAPKPPRIADGFISDFEQDTPTSRFGFGWTTSTDERMGGSSTAEMSIVTGGAAGTGKSLETRGELVAGAPFLWAGPMFFPGTSPMSPADVSGFREIVFWARGDAGTYQVMVFAQKIGMMPAMVGFEMTADWKQHRIPLADFGGIDGSDLTGVLFTPAAPGRFSFRLDQVELR
jgi:imidazolonepropionase-like amidohydrolase